MEKEKTERRSFFSKIAKLGLAGGIGALLIGRFGDKTFVPPVHAADIVIDATNTGSGTTKLTSSGLGPSFEGVNSAGDTGIRGEGTTAGIGVMGEAGTMTPSTSNVGVLGTASSGEGVAGWTHTAVGVHGMAWSSGGTAVMASTANSGAIPLVAQGYSGQSVNLQEWRDGSYTPISAVNKNGWLGVGTSSPARSIHLQGSNACFRMDRDADSAAFILVRTASGDFNTIWKTFYVGVNASGVNNGEFFIGDVENQVSGPSTKRLWIDNSGQVHIPDLASGDITLANDFIVTEDEKAGVAFKNDAGEKIAILDREGNLRIKGDVIKDPTL